MKCLSNRKIFILNNFEAILRDDSLLVMIFFKLYIVFHLVFHRVFPKKIECKNIEKYQLYFII